MKKFNLDILENADEETIRTVSGKFSAVSEKDILRLYKKTEEKYAARTGGVPERTETGSMADEKIRVVNTSKPVHRKVMALVSALVLFAGAGAVGYFAYNRHNELIPAYQDENTGEGSAVSEDRSPDILPFGDISDAEIRFVTPAYAPFILDTTPEEAEAFSVFMNACYVAAPWIVDDDSKVRDGERILVFVDTGEKRFRLEFSGENILDYDDGSVKTRYRTGGNIFSGVREYFSASEGRQNMMIWSRPEDITIDGVWKNNEHIPDKISEPAVNENLKDCDIIEYEPLLEFDADYSVIENVASGSENIVTGIVEKIDYHEDTSPAGGMSYTTVRIGVTGDVKGIFSKGEPLELCMPGGFISMRGLYGDTLYQTGGKYGDGTERTEEETDRTWYHEIIDSGEVPLTGKEYAFFIGRYNDRYEITGGEHGIFYRCGSTYIGKEKTETGEGHSDYSFVYYDSEDLMSMVK